MKVRIATLLALAVLCLAGPAPAAAACKVTSWNLTSDWNASTMFPDQANPVLDACARPIWHFQRFIPGVEPGTGSYAMLDGYYNDYSWLPYMSGYENWQPLDSEYCDGYYQTCTPAVGKNFNATPVTNVNANITVAAGGVALHPSQNQRAVVAWRSPFKGNVSINATFTDIDQMGGDGLNYYVHKGAQQLTTGEVPPQGSVYTYTNARVPVVVGEMIYFSIDSGIYGELSYDSIQLDAVITKVR